MKMETRELTLSTSGIPVVSNKPVSILAVPLPDDIFYWRIKSATRIFVFHPSMTGVVKLSFRDKEFEAEYINRLRDSYVYVVDLDGNRVINPVRVVYGLKCEGCGSDSLYVYDCGCQKAKSKLRRLK